MPAISSVEFREFSARHHNASRNWLVVKLNTLAPHNVCSPVGAQAEIHLCASIVNCEIQEYHAEFYDAHYFSVFGGFPRQKDGYVSLSQEPGLGLVLDEDEIAAHPRLQKTTARGGKVRGI